MKTIATIGIVFCVIGLGLNLLDLYFHDPRLASNIFLLVSSLLCNLSLRLTLDFMYFNK